MAEIVAQAQTTVVTLPKIIHGIENKGVYSFTLENANVSIANALRRVILSDIETVVFNTDDDNINILENTTRFHNEILKQRLGCIPIHIKDIDNIENILVELNKHNIVVHESDLPNGKGFSPLTWQILEGKNIIPVSIFEASIKVDSGKVYFKDKILFNGTELVDELRVKQYQITEKLIIKFLKNIDNLPKLKSTLYESYHRKRNPEDSILDVNKTIYEQFNLLRTVDNERYPAFFINNGEQYIVKIYKKDKNER